MVPIFDGWFCFGGTEIINNARAVGYARTASQLAILDRPVSGTIDDQIVARNLATNPSMEAGAGAAEIRRNLIQPDTVTTTGWAPTAGALAAVGGRLQLTANGGSAIRLGVTSSMSVAKPTGAWVASFRAQTSDPTLTGVRVYLYDTVSGTIRAQQSLPIIAGGGENKYDFTLTAAGGTFNLVYLEFYGTAIANGAVGYISEPILEAGTIPRAFFNGSIRPKYRRNLALNPRATTTSGWLSNNIATNPLTRGVTPPVPHPLGIATAGEQSSTGTNSVLATAYNIDSLANTGTPQRALSISVLVTEPGYRVPAGSGWAQSDELPVNQWVTIKQSTSTAAGAYAAFFVAKITGNASTTARAYMTAVLAEEGAGPVGDYFDGTTPAPAGFATAWNSTVDNSGSYMYDTDYTIAWVGTPGSSESSLTGVAVTSTVGGGVVRFQSTRWVSTGTKSMRIRTVGVVGSTYVIMRNLTTQDAGKTLVILAKMRLESPTIVEAAYARSLFITTNGTPVTIQGPQTPNTVGVHELRWTVTLPSDMTNGSIRIYHGGGAGDVDIWVDDFAVVEAPYGGTYFDGNTQDADGFRYEWDGAPDASASIMVIPGVVPENNYCDINWFSHEHDECYTNLFGALREEVAYESQFIPEEAPWYSEASGYNTPYTPARKFLGAFGLSVSSLSDSSRTVGITEGILSGGVLGRERRAVPRFRFRVMLTAVDEEGLEYGKAWLSKALSEQTCSTHGPSCGSSDLTFLVGCPPDQTGLPDTTADEKWDSYTRMYHDVKCIEGPVTTDQFQRGENSWGAIVEFTLAAGVPNMFGVASKFLPIDQAGETIVQDIPFNYIPYPSAEIAGADVTAATNYSLNPSVETNATGWASVPDGVAITAGMLTAGRVTGEIQAVGTSSYRVVFTATGAGANGYFCAQQEVDLSARPAGSAVSMNFWAAEALISGTPVRPDIEMIAYWRNAGGVLRTDNLGTVPVNGGAVSVKSITPPAGADRVIVRALARLTSWPAGTVVRLYADALAVTVP